VASHGGIAEPEGYSKVPIGASSLYPYSRDDYTFELAQAISDALHRKTGARPAMARSLAARSLYDANRDRPACCGDLPSADALFHGWHSCVRKLHTEIQKTCGRGLFLDLHGQSHPQKLVEVGLGLDGPSLGLPAEHLENWVTLSNIRAMAERAQVRNVTYQALAMGPHSFGGLLEARGWPSVPSPTHGKDTDFFCYPGIGPAGTLARFYGSLAGGAIDGIQVEAPYAARETAEARDSFADTLADVVIEFMGLYHDLDLVDFTAETQTGIRPGPPPVHALASPPTTWDPSSTQPVSRSSGLGFLEVFS
jgi:hypothetical protein